MAMDRQEFLDLAGAHALCILDGEDLVRFKQALVSADPEMRAAYLEAEHAAWNLSLAVPEAPLSPSVLVKLMAHIEPVQAPSPKVRIAWIMPFRIAEIAAVCLVLVTVGLLSYVDSLRHRTQSLRGELAENRTQILALQDSLSQKEAMLDVIRSNHMQVVVMNGQDVNPAGYGKIIWDPVGKKAILHVSQLPQQPADKDYQLWVIRDKVPVDAGVFQVRGKEHDGQLYKIDRLVEADKSHINAFAITLEPKGGMKQPSGKMYLLGSI